MLIVMLSVVMAYLLRFNFHIPANELPLLYIALGVVFVLRLGSFLIAKTYTGVVFHTSIADAKRIFFAVSCGTLVLATINFVLGHLVGYYLMPNSVVGIDFFVTIFAMTALRIFIKILYLEIRNYNKDKKNVLIYGTSSDAIMAKKALERDLNTHYHIIGFINDALVGQKIEGSPIFSNSDIARLLQVNEVQTLIIAHKISTSRKQQLIEIGIKHNVLVSTVPPAEKWVNGELSAKQIREIKIDDLLERAPILLDTELIAAQVSNQVVLVTGAAGSIGSEIARQLIKFHPRKLILLDQAETPLYELDLEFGEQLHVKNYEIVVADVRNKDRMTRVFEAFKPTIVYHAAAYKHVPMIEENPQEAVNVNVMGVMVVSQLAVKYKVNRFVMVSTDKAVNPTNVMGASKRVAELYVQSLQNTPENQTRFITTRFGNVLGSNGSVIPHFKKQIAQGGPITVTHPEITRYFMTIPEACELVLQAGTMGQGGEIYVFDMGQPVKIIDLAIKMIKLSGLEPEKDIAIKITGLRPGEKLYEELLGDKSKNLPTHHEKIMIAKDPTIPYEHMQQKTRQILRAVLQQNNVEVVRIIKQIVPEFISNNSQYERLDK